MYRPYSLSEMQAMEQDQLDGLFKVLGKIIKAPIKIAAKLAPAVVAGMTGIPIGAIMSSGSPNQPATGAGGVAVSQADLINARVVQIQAQNAASQAAQQSPVYYAQNTGAVVAQGGSGLPGWVIPVAVAGGVGVILLITLRK